MCLGFVLGATALDFKLAIASGKSPFQNVSALISVSAGLGGMSKVSAAGSDGSNAVAEVIPLPLVMGFAGLLFKTYRSGEGS
jgi:hypothetical protein